MVRYIRPKLVNSRRLRNMLVDCSKPAEDATYMYNRNPRNLEMMRIAYRPTGYHLDMPGRSFWNKWVLTVTFKIKAFIHVLQFFIEYFRLIVEKTTRDFTAKVQHYTGSTLLECNTNEWSLAKQLYRPYDMAAYINFGRVSTLWWNNIWDFHSM